MNLNFLFYDYETFGINTKLDKPVQFAGIRTDEDFCVISKPVVFYMYPPIDYLPDPNSILVTGITPDFSYFYGTNEFYFSKKVFAFFNIKNSCIVGFNNISFDDEFTRNIFYRNFLDSYSWQYAHNRSKWDMLTVLYACYAMRPDGINWPKKKCGLPTFKLEKITEANNIIHKNQHDALSDVYATIEIAKKIKKVQPKLFCYLFKNKNKWVIRRFILNNYGKMIVYISSFFGAIRKNVGIIFPLFWNLKNKNVLITLDLLSDNFENLIKLFNDFSLDKDFLKKILDMKVFQFVNISKCPILFPFYFLRKKDICRLHINQKKIKKNVDLLNKKKNSFMERTREIFSSDIFLKKKKKENVELNIYERFFSQEEQFFFKKLHKDNPFNFYKYKKFFSSEKTQQLLFLCRARNFPFFLNFKESKKWEIYYKKKFCIEKIGSYKKKIKELLWINRNKKRNVFLLLNLLEFVKKKEF